MRRFLGAAVALVLAVDIAVVAVRTTDETTAPPSTHNGAGALVTGTADAIAADVEQTDPVLAPFTISVPSRGAGGATIRAAVVEGRRAAIVWDSGRPLTFSSNAGGLDPGPVHLEADPRGITYTLDGAVRSLLAGDYRITTPVAVGTGGLATARDGVEFGADVATSIVTRGSAFVHIAPRPLTLTGPGRVSARGQFSVRTAAGERELGTLIFGPGAFEVRLRPVGTTYVFEATFQGPIQ